MYIYIELETTHEDVEDMEVSNNDFPQEDDSTPSSTNSVCFSTVAAAESSESSSLSGSYISYITNMHNIAIGCSCMIKPVCESRTWN